MADDDDDDHDEGELEPSHEEPQNTDDSSLDGDPVIDISNLEPRSIIGISVEDVVANFIRRSMGSGPLDTGSQWSKVLGSKWVRSLGEAQMGKLVSGVLKSNLPTLSNPSSFKEVSETPTAYSRQMKFQSSYFDSVASEIGSFEKLQTEVAGLLKRNPRLRFVWRGARRATWGLHSSLFRKLAIHNGVEFPGGGGVPRSKQPFPSEDQMVGTERAMIEAARTLWRMDDLGPLEILARLQHFGAPTRLIDVTLNPYIAAWFAAERDPGSESHDGRLFAIATAPVPQEGEESEPATIRISDLPGLPLPFWHFYETKQQRQEEDWGTGSRRTLWVPPAYDPRIVAQNAAFILDGVPMTSQEIAPYFTFAHNEYLSRADNLASSSIYARTEKSSRSAKAIKPNLAPTFSWRITPDGKRDIQDTLERHFGYTFATIYPDNAGLGAYLAANLDQFAPEMGS